jgi:hypothetical protein
MELFSLNLMINHKGLEFVQGFTKTLGFRSALEHSLSINKRIKPLLLLVRVVLQLTLQKSYLMLFSYKLSFCFLEVSIDLCEPC